ncbi:eukaryotic translation initiation factor 4E-1B-like isoform X1 [Arapaima gigas]
MSTALFHAMSSKKNPHDQTMNVGREDKQCTFLGRHLKHPLQNRWALWFYKNDKSKVWQDNLKIITKFDTVEDFWA